MHKILRICATRITMIHVFSSRKHNAMLFDLFEIQAEELSSRITDEYDPDVNYYAQNLKDMCNSNYYDIDEFN